MNIDRSKALAAKIAKAVDGQPTTVMETALALASILSFTVFTAHKESGTEIDMEEAADLCDLLKVSVLRHLEMVDED